jgi:hypothetical protein
MNEPESHKASTPWGDTLEYIVRYFGWSAPLEHAASMYKAIACKV